MNARRMVVAVAACCVALVSAELPAQEPGKLTHIAAEADKKQTYMLYLPKAFAAERRWPVLYVLDPDARGELAAKQFQDLAEKSGFVVAASKVAKNGPFEQQDAALEAMMNDLEKRVQVDEHRKFVAGFSGQARAAILTALVRDGTLTGVIACGAGLPPLKKPLEQAPPFPVALVVGTDDFNYQEVLELTKTFDKLHAKYKLVTFIGSHDWPPKSALGDALKWLNEQAGKQ